MSIYKTISRQALVLYLCRFSQPWDVQNFHLNFDTNWFSIHLCIKSEPKTSRRNPTMGENLLYSSFSPRWERLLCSRFSGGKTAMGGKLLYNTGPTTIPLLFCIYKSLYLPYRQYLYTSSLLILYTSSINRSRSWLVQIYRRPNTGLPDRWFGKPMHI